MACTPADFKIRFPEFSGIADERIQMFLDDAADLMGIPDKWCCGESRYNVAQCYYAAHMLAMSERTDGGDSSSTGPISHKEVDDVVIKRAVQAVSPHLEDLYSTSYGKRYIQYRKICFTGPIGV